MGGSLLVRVVGLEPTRKAREPKSRMSTNSIIPAYYHTIIPHSPPRHKKKIMKPIWYYPSCTNWSYSDIQKLV